MANIKKNFNFRNGVQVDDDNLLVTSTGLVGIGTTIPSEALDVRGNAIISGFTSITSGSIGVVTITTLDPTQIIGAGVSIKSGIITAQGSGIVTFFGDARFLQGMPTSQWQDVDVGLGYTSIFNTGGNVGIATTDPRTSMQVGNNVDAGQKGVGISSAGNINASGIISATSFVGDFTGNIVSPSTFSGNVTLNADFDVDGHTNLDNVSIAGVTTFASATVFDGNLDINADIDVDGHTNLDNLNVSGVSTFSGRVEGAATNNVLPFLYSNMADLPSAGSYHGAVAHVHSTGALYFAHAGQWWELLNVESTGKVGTGTEFYNIEALESDHLNITGISTFAGAIDLNSDIDVDGHTNLDNLSVTGVSTFAGNVNTTFVGASSTSFALKMGVGTTEAPVNDIQVRKSGNAEIQITSETGSAGLTFGRETGTSNTNNGELRYGGGSGFTYSSDTSLDLINYGTGNFNYHLSANNPGGATGNFFWHKGSNNVRLMTLTNTGRLGIGLTNPSDELHVDGGATVSGALGVGGNINLSGTMIGNVQGTVVGNVVGVLAGNTNTTVGISTLNNLSIAGIATAARLRGNKLAVGENPNLDLVSIFISDTNKIIINDVGQIGISTTTFLTGVTINALTANACFAQIGCGVTQFPSGSVDFSTAGGLLTSRRYMVPPKVSNTQRGNLTGLVSGAMIYNTNLNKLQVYNGSGWETVTSS